MARRPPLPPSGFDELTVDEKVDYVQFLWDRIAAAQEQVPVPDWHREVLEKRLAKLESNPDSAVDWSEVRDQLRRQLKKDSDR